MKRSAPLMSILGLALAAGAAFAQPANDDCSAALALTGTYPQVTAGVDISTANPTAEFPTSCGGMSYTVWYKLVAANNGTITLRSCAADAPECTVTDTVLSIWESSDGTCDTLVQLACVDDACDGLRSIVSTSATAGVTYYLQIGKYGAGAPPAGATIAMSVSAPNLIEPPTGIGQALPNAITNCDATPVLFEVATSAGSLPASTVTIDLSAVGGSSTQAMTDPENDSIFSYEYSVPAGTGAGALNLPFRVADSNGLGSTGSLALTINQCPPPAAANDFCTDAIDLSSNTSDFLTDPVQISGNELAPEAAMCAFNPSQTIWYKIRPAVNGELLVSTCAASAPATNIGDTVLALYSSDDGTCDTLVPLVCVDDSCGLRTIVSTNATAGTWYYIQAAKYNGAATPGLDTMQLFVQVPTPPPPGTWLEQGDAGDMPADAQVPAGEGSLTEIRGSLALDADMYLIDICDQEQFGATLVGGATFDTQLFLFTTDGTGVTHDDDTTTAQSTITGQFVPGNGQYYIAISAYNNDPLDSDGQLIWANTPFNVERAPDGPGAAGVIGGWTGGGASGAYRLQLSGACFPGGGGCPACAADFNQDGGVDGSDVEAFFTTWESGEACGDVNQDGGVDGADVEAFYAVWEAGGC